MTHVAVVGHIEWVDFLRVEHLPRRGEVQHAEREKTQAGGGAVVAAAALAELGAEVELFSAVGADPDGDRAQAQLRERGIVVHASRRSGPTRQVLTLLDRDGERTIITLGERMQPEASDPLDWGRLGNADGVYLTAGDLGTVQHARAGRVLVATPRIREQLDGETVSLDALVYSASDEDECRWARALEPCARVIVATEGPDGGRWWGESEGRWEAVPPPSRFRDSYGAGDAFAAGLTFGLAAGLPVGEAAAIGARCGAQQLTRVGGP